eukprot:GCRY01002771.1.p1 GENE.GCRY01002771.1~~GCRY01002771.1.p1  ORF type:complete len:483 (+),score=106.13 GCRY01002771.1:165-1613(+)
MEPSSSESSSQNSATKSTSPKKEKGSEPRHIGSGVLKGLGTVGASVALGFAGLVTHPIEGARKEGPKGFAKGVGKGVMAATILPVAGLVGGGVAVYQGAKNTPGTVREMMHKRTPEPIEGTWVTDENASETASQELAVYDEFRDHVNSECSVPSSQSSSNETTHSVKDLSYYEVLEVEKDASPDTIRRQYYIHARKWHPDKNKDPTAHERFQAIGQAYQVLADPALRERYDKYGPLGVTGENTMEPEAFFNMMFGSEKFEHLIGKLTVVSRMMAEEADRAVDQKELKAKLKAEQCARELALACYIRQKAQLWVDGKEEEFSSWCVREAELLRNVSFGSEILHTIGYVYQTRGMQWLGWRRKAFVGIPGLMEKFKDNAHTFKKRFQMTSQSLKLMKIQSEMEKNGADPGSTLGGGGDAEDVLIEAMWMVTALDIDSTIRGVCSMLLHAPQHSAAEPFELPQEKEVYRRRADALVKLGKIFQMA